MAFDFHSPEWANEFKKVLDSAATYLVGGYVWTGGAVVRVVRPGDRSFSVYQPTRVVFGDGAVGELAIECKRLGIERAIVVTDQFLREKTDTIARVEKALGARLAGIYDGVIPDTGVEVIDQGAAF